MNIEQSNTTGDSVGQRVKTHFRTKNKVSPSYVLKKKFCNCNCCNLSRAKIDKIEKKHKKAIEHCDETIVDLSSQIFELKETISAFEKNNIESNEVTKSGEICKDKDKIDDMNKNEETKSEQMHTSVSYTHLTLPTKA